MLVLVSDGFWWRINAMLGFPYRDGQRPLSSSVLFDSSSSSRPVD